MRRHILTLFVFVITIPLSHALSVNLLEMNLNYKDGLGSMNAAKIKIDHENVAAEIHDYDFDIEKNNEDLEFKNFNTNLRIKKFEEQVSIIKDLKELNISNAGLTYTDNIFLSLDNLYANAGRNQFNVDKLYLECQKLEQDPIASCLKESRAEVNSITLPNVLSGILYQEILKTEPQDTINKADKGYRPRLKNIKLAVKDNNFVGTAVMRILFNIKFNIYGKLLVDQDNKQLIIKNFTVKKGFIPITGAVLLALKKMRIESVKVSGNTIIIDL